MGICHYGICTCLPFSDISKGLHSRLGYMCTNEYEKEKSVALVNVGNTKARSAEKILDSQGE